jgi:hypothetical protein
MAKAQTVTKAPPALVKGIKPPRMRPALAQAVQLIVEQGTTQREAAKRAGMDESALGRALRRPPIAAYLETAIAQFAIGADSLKARAKVLALHRAIDLMHNAQSEAVQARMVELFAGESKGPGVNVVVNQAPSGYQYRRPLDQASSDIEGQAIEINQQSPNVGQ